MKRVCQIRKTASGQFEYQVTDILDSESFPVCGWEFGPYSLEACKEQAKERFSGITDFLFN